LNRKKEHKKILEDTAAAGAAAIFLVTLAAWTSPAFVFAEAGSEEGQAQAGEHQGFNWWGFLGKLFDSTPLFGGLIYLLLKPLTNFLAQKNLYIKTNITKRKNN